MAGVLLDMAISLDGFASGPDGGDAGLHDWYFDPSPASAPIIAELQSSIGAMIMGRTTYGDASEQAETEDNPYPVPHFILTHRPPAEAAKDIVFVADGIESALRQARAAAGERLVCVAGGAATARQFLAAGLIDEIQLHVVPALFGGGLRLFEQGSFERIGLELTRTVAAPNVTHLRYRVRR